MGTPKKTSQVPENKERMGRREAVGRVGRILAFLAVGGGVAGCSGPEEKNPDSGPPKPDISVRIDGNKVQPDDLRAPDGEIPDTALQEDSVVRLDGRLDQMQPDKGQLDQTPPDQTPPKPDVMKPKKPVINKFEVDFGSIGGCVAGTGGKIKTKGFPLILNASNVGPNDTWTIILKNSDPKGSPGTLSATFGKIQDLPNVKYTPGNTGTITMTIIVTNSAGSTPDPYTFPCL